MSSPMPMTRSMAAVAAIVAAATLVRQGAAEGEKVFAVNKVAKGPCDDSAAMVAMLNGTGVDTSACMGTSADGECQAGCAAGYSAPAEGAAATAFMCTNETFVKKAGEPDLVCSAQACTTHTSGNGTDHSDCDGKVTGETCQVACAAGFTGTATEATCGSDGAFAYTSAAPMCISTTPSGGEEAAACNATGYPDLEAWFSDIAEHVTTLSEIDGEDAKRTAFETDMLPSLKTKICDSKDALKEVSWDSNCDMITEEAKDMVMGDSVCLCGGKCEAMWDYLTQEDQGESEEDSDPFADPSAQLCRYANCYVTEACAAAGTDVEPMMDNLTAMVGSQCNSYLSAVADGAEPARNALALIVAAIFAGLAALF